ncbi:hypothetical protein [Virgibacillus pantothenticus]|uniref:hypothetical protein n=1 Tax=Virgibacillus pantothenticus TaxID=1473 RepID=UPI000984CDFF|nr:hypothetical protein [Virgibacillus pantothenticus]
MKDYETKGIGGFIVCKEHARSRCAECAYIEELKEIQRKYWCAYYGIKAELDKAETMLKEAKHPLAKTEWQSYKDGIQMALKLLDAEDDENE